LGAERNAVRPGKTRLNQRKDQQENPWARHGPEPIISVWFAAARP
jgi:hypothetical protein